MRKRPCHPQEKPTAPNPGGSLHVQKHPLPVHVASAKYTCVCSVCAKSCLYVVCVGILCVCWCSVYVCVWWHDSIICLYMFGTAYGMFSSMYVCDMCSCIYTE